MGGDAYREGVGGDSGFHASPGTATPPTRSISSLTYVSMLPNTGVDEMGLLRIAKAINSVTRSNVTSHVIDIREIQLSAQFWHSSMVLDT